jgi:putative transposase
VELKHTSGGVSNLNYHLVWCPKYRLLVLVDEVADDLEALIREKASELDVEVKHLVVKPDHVHLFVKSPPELSPAQLAHHRFKGYSSRILWERYQRLRSRMPSLWSRSYYAGAAGHVSDKTIANYIAAQETRSS